MMIKNLLTNPYVIAEAGINHNGDFKLALKLVEQAAKTNANAIKFQNYLTEDFIFDRSLKFTYLSKGKKITEPMYDLFKRCEMPREWIPKLKTHCDLFGIDFLSTPTNLDGIQDLVEVGVKMLKNGSDYLTHLPLLSKMSETNIPIILSTGMANKEEINDAIITIENSGKSEIILMHCTSIYPTLIKDINLNRMLGLKNAFGKMIGYSDHSQGCDAAIQAVSMGAKIFEKHFTIDNQLEGPDHWFSLDTDQFSDYVENINNAYKRLGNYGLVPALGEKESCLEFRLSLRYKSNFKIGKKIRKEDLTVAKPFDGLPPKHFDEVVGNILRKNVRKGEPVNWENFST